MKEMKQTLQIYQENMNKHPQDYDGGGGDGGEVALIELDICLSSPSSRCLSSPCSE